MTAILDTVIATTFVLLLFSLVVTSLNELIATWMDRRAVFFKISLQEMLNSKTTGNEQDTGPLTVTNLLQHGLITSLSRGPYSEKNFRGTGVPSYIPANLFGSAVISLLKGKTKEDLQASISKIPAGSRLHSSMQAFYDEVGGDVAEFRKRVESWFDDAMSRASGWYKSNAQWWMFWIALALAIFANVDAIRIVGELSQNPELRQRIAAQEEEYLKSITETEPGKPLPGGEQVKAETERTVTEVAKAQAKLDEASADFKKNLNALSATGISMGWKLDGEGFRALLEKFLETAPTALLGWFMTACAASMGAPFWFDTLSRIVTIRSSGKAPEKAGG